jgi:hypothetical protein
MAVTDRYSFKDSYESALRASGSVTIVTGPGKYDRPCKGTTIDVYDVLQAFEVTNPALQHLIKKALCAGLRGHKDRQQDLNEILESARRAIELEIK